ncbi:aa3-type cytochrome c oxidase subunit IV [Sphingomonas sp.]|nr:aa3-type cytochrome c oxidase subunit IV [Sphingomonas sp.]
MADHGDMKAHESTYNGVMALLKWGTIVGALLTLGVLWLIAG